MNKTGSFKVTYRKYNAEEKEWQSKSATLPGNRLPGGRAVRLRAKVIARGHAWEHVIDSLMTCRILCKQPWGFGKGNGRVVADGEDIAGLAAHFALQRVG